MKKIKYLLCCLIVSMLFLTGCQKDDEKMVEGMGVFYLNTEGTGLVKQKYSLKGTTSEEKIEELLSEMKKETDTINYISAIPMGVEIEKWEIQSGKMDLYFNVSYNNIDAAAEILLRAAVIQTLTQIDEVEYVSFFAAGQPVTDNKGKEIGYQSEEDFVKNIGSTLHSYQKVDLKLYFSNEDGTMLEEEIVSVRYNSNMSVEKLIVEELIEGPVARKHQATYDSKIKLLGVSVRDGICYVNFDEGFLANEVVVDPKITIYSLVNSIIEGGGAAKVQILVNGEANVKYKDTVDLSQPFSRNLEIVREEE